MAWLKKIDQELARFSKFRDSGDFSKTTEIFYAMAAGAAMVSPEFRARLVGSIRPEYMPGKWAAILGSIASEDNSKTSHLLETRLDAGEAGGDSPLDVVLREITLYEDYVAMIEARVDIATAASSGSPSAFISCLEVQADKLRRTIRNIGDGPEKKEEETVSW